ncbi:hypothetical protein [Jiella mangrovi]|uniref:CHAT domain-containing protein n=1 Tax=Jiella mangrovi TaxID=2821407 RepID=A0ABS4BKN9_9HYPH|nr:hypothetical protein [Jiella mangrovi]MBP0617236.1 hypothetical protein [Jiella mangrovi]
MVLSKPPVRRFVGSMASRLALQAIISGTVMVGLHAIGGGAGIYDALFGPDAEPERSAEETERVTRLEADSPVVLGGKTVRVLEAGDDASRVALASGMSDRSKARDASAVPPAPAATPAAAMPAGVILFTACQPACDSRDPLLSEAGFGAKRSGNGQEAADAWSKARSPQPFARTSPSHEEAGLVDRTLEGGKDLLAATYARTVTGFDATLGRLSPF